MTAIRPGVVPVTLDLELDALTIIPPTHTREEEHFNKTQDRHETLQTRHV